MAGSRALRIKMFSCSCTVKELSQVLGLSTAALYRRLNGKISFTISEMLKCVEHLGLTDEERNQIFFASEVS